MRLLVTKRLVWNFNLIDVVPSILYFLMSCIDLKRALAFRGVKQGKRL